MAYTPKSGILQHNHNKTNAPQYQCHTWHSIGVQGTTSRPRGTPPPASAKSMPKRSRKRPSSPPANWPTLPHPRPQSSGVKTQLSAAAHRAKHRNQAECRLSCSTSSTNGTAIKRSAGTQLQRIERMEPQPSGSTALRAPCSNPNRTP